MRRVIDIDELAAQLKVHKSTVYRMLKQGGVPAFKVGSDWRFDSEAIDRWIDDGGVKATKPAKAKLKA
jgi:excisionase family DNA binding protein